MSSVAERKRPKKSGSRHKDRHMISLPGALYRALQASADLNGRPLSWEVRRILTRYITDNNLWQAGDTAPDPSGAPRPD